jgi:hypothetical protein
VSDTPVEAVVSGPDGLLRMHRPFHNSERITIERRGEIVESIDLPLGGSGYRFEIEEVRDCVVAGRVESSRRPHADTLGVLGWMDDIRRSIGVAYPGEEADAAL